LFGNSERRTEVKRLIISEILILSDKERKARRETFDPVRTIIFGGNTTGKSALIKAIYQTFGAEPAKQHPRWKEAEVKTVVKFGIDDNNYQLLRDNSYFAIFTGDGTFLKSFARVTTELAPYLASLMNFGLILASRDEEPQTPPPAFFFLPFYMDQDASWQNAWTAFDRLYQYYSWKEALVDYHTGIKNNAYYRVSADYITKRVETQEAAATERGVANVIRRLERDTSATIFSLDQVTFGERIQRMLTDSQALADTEGTLRVELSKLNAERALQSNRLEIAERALGEISQDFKFLSRLHTDSVECPTCGNLYANDFAARFAIATDEDKVAEFIAHLRAEIHRLDTEISKVYANYSIAKEQAAHIQEVLQEAHGEVTLQTLIESEGRRAADNLLSGQLTTLQEARVKAEAEAARLKEDLDVLDRRAASVRRERLQSYSDRLRKNFFELDVRVYTQAVFQTLTPSIFETGSTLPRALLAYQFAILSLIFENSPATVCPIVIDAPNQQGQDGEHLPQILKFISENQPADAQLILGIENDLGIQFGGKQINTPSEKYSLLQATQYDSVHAEVYGLLKRSLA
jgi:hypothetical protein